ncbi:hypothetical protein Hanom_Chr08g00718491 [Helianthus anomalus]
MGMIVLTQLATDLSVFATSALLNSMMDQSPMTGPSSGSGQFPRCSSCNETDRVSCLCNRWLDGCGCGNRWCLWWGWGWGGCGGGDCGGNGGGDGGGGLERDREKRSKNVI